MSQFFGAGEFVNETFTVARVMKASQKCFCLFFYCRSRVAGVVEGDQGVAGEGGREVRKTSNNSAPKKLIDLGVKSRSGYEQLRRYDVDDDDNDDDDDGDDDLEVSNVLLSGS